MHIPERGKNARPHVMELCRPSFRPDTAESKKRLAACAVSRREYGVFRLFALGAGLLDGLAKVAHGCRGRFCNLLERLVGGGDCLLE